MANRASKHLEEGPTNHVKKKSPGVSRGFLFVQVQIKSATFTWLAFIAPDGTTVKVFSLHAFQSGFRFFLIGHFNKTKTAGPSGLTIVDDSCTVNGAVRLKCFTQGHVVHAPCKVSYKNIHVSDLKNERRR